MDDNTPNAIAIELALDAGGTVVSLSGDPAFPGNPDRLVGRVLAEALALAPDSALRRGLAADPAAEMSGLEMVTLPNMRRMLLEFRLTAHAPAGVRVRLAAGGALVGFNDAMRAALGAVHEWNNTIGTIAGFADLLKGGGLPADKSQRYLERIEASVAEAREVGERLSRDLRRIAAETARKAT